MQEPRRVFLKMIDAIFSGPPKPPYTYNLPFPSDTPLFFILKAILVEGAKKLYGDEIEPSDITPQKLSTLKEYMASIGYELKHEYSQDNSNIVHIWFEPFMKQTNCHGIPTWKK